MTRVGPWSPQTGRSSPGRWCVEKAAADPGRRVPGGQVGYRKRDKRRSGTSPQSGVRPLHGRTLPCLFAFCLSCRGRSNGSSRPTGTKRDGRVVPRTFESGLVIDGRGAPLQYDPSKALSELPVPSGLLDGSRSLVVVFSRRRSGPLLALGGRGNARGPYLGSLNRLSVI
jgi:hypothetical protein